MLYLYIMSTNNILVVIIKNNRIKNLIFLSIIFLLITPLMANGQYIRNNNIFKINNPNHDTNDDNYKMIIIGPSQYSTSIEPLIIHKNSHGIESKFVSLDDIYSGTYFDVQGRDNPEKIKYFIKDTVENWNSLYILFIGNFKQVPVRFCYNNDNYPAYPELKFVSELYYADIYDSLGELSSWDLDNDGIFGEWDGEEAEDKNINLTPDIAVGRLACNNIDEVNIVVNKIINYESQPADSSWFKRMVVAGGDTYKKFEGYEGEIYNQRALDEMDDFTPVKLWASTGKLTKNGLEIVQEINKGCGFLYFSGHGNPDIWATYTPERELVGNFDKININFLKNQGKLPVCLVGGCHNSQFTTDLNRQIRALTIWDIIFQNSNNYNGCWSWLLTSREQGGSIATIGTTGLCWYSAEYNGGGTDWLNVHFFNEYANGEKTLGNIWKNTISDFIESYPIDWDTPSGGDSSLNVKAIQQWTILGDPSLKIGGYEN